MGSPAAESPSIEEALESFTIEGALYEKLEDGKLRCFACGHRCMIPAGQKGVCKVRTNDAGTLRVPFGYVSALQCDPVEKKPFFHALPGSLALSFGMLGCDYHCGYCQNWVTSQVLRDKAARGVLQPMTPRQLVVLAEGHGASIMASTYNEPLITSEWAVAVFRDARAAGMKTAYVSNGNGTAEVLAYIRPWVDFYKVDLKSFDDKHYRSLGGTLKAVLETIARLAEMGFWLEIVTLTISGFNDSDAELTAMARFIAGVSRDIPWHVTAFHPDYKMPEPPRTSIATLERAAAIGKAEGLRFVYAGNLPGMVGTLENTYCPACNALLIERHGFRVLRNRLVSSDRPSEGNCPDCAELIPGVWCE